MVVWFAYFRNFLSPQPASPIKPLPRTIIVAGRKAFAPILAPLSSASPEGEGIMKIMINRRKTNREILCVLFGLEVFKVSSVVKKITRCMALVKQSECHARIHGNNPYVTVFKGEFF